MSLGDTLAHLDAALAELHAALTHVSFAVVEAYPRHTCGDDSTGDVVFVELYGDATTDLQGRLEAARYALRGALDASECLDVRGTRAALARVHEELRVMRDALLFDLLYPRLHEVLAWGARKGGPHDAWAKSVRDALEGCLPPLARADASLSQAWPELLDVVTRHVNVHAVTSHHWR